VDAPPDVILITLDTTRADYLGSYGHPEDLTPNLDSLAKTGARFELAISTAALTPVSHAAILTGMQNHEHGLRVLSAKSGYRLDPDVPTLASLLRQNGYRTAAIHSALPVSARFGLDRGFDLFESFTLEEPWPGTEGSDEVDVEAAGTASGESLEHYQRRSDETTDMALEFLRDAESPFFLWIHYWDPHDDFVKPPIEFRPPDEAMARAKRTKGASQRMFALMRLQYASEVRFVDSQIGRLLQAVHDRRPDDSTLLAVVSDHGEGLADHDWWAHRILYQEQIHVPLLIRAPGIAAGTEVSALVRTTDLSPTILDYLGLDAPASMSGVSLRALIEGRDEAPRMAFADQLNGYDMNATMLAKRPNDDFLFVAMDVDAKLIYRPSRPELSELYDLREDPRETLNIYASRPYDVLRLKQALARQNAWVTAPFPPEEGFDVSPEAIAALEALGYAAGDPGLGDTPDWAWTCPDLPGHVTADRADVGECATPLIPIRAAGP
jgi:arylsulfatase A-like enzyme